MLHASGHLVLAEFLPEEVRRRGPAAEVPGASSTAPDLHALIETALQSQEGNLYERVLEAVEKVLLPRVLRLTQGHQTQASEVLGISRGTLRQKLRRLGFAIDKVCTEDNSLTDSDD